MFLFAYSYSSIYLDIWEQKRAHFGFILLSLRLPRGLSFFPLAQSIVSNELAMQKWISMGLSNYEENYLVYP